MCVCVFVCMCVCVWSRRSGNRIPVGAKFSAPAQTGPGAHSAFYTMGVRSFTGVKRPARGVEHPPRLAPRLKREPLLLLWGFLVCSRANLTLLYFYYMGQHLCMCKAIQFRSISNTRERYRPEPDHPAHLCSRAVVFSHHCRLTAFIRMRKNSARFSKMLVFQFFVLF